MMRDRNTAADGISIDDGKVEIEAQASTTESIQNCTTFDCQEQERIDGRLPIGAREAAGCFLPNAEKLVGGIYDAIIIKGDTIDLSDALINRLRFNGLTWAEVVDLCRLSFREDFSVIIWRQYEGGERSNARAT